MRAERRLQRGFTLQTLAGCLLLLFAIDLFLNWLERQPDRMELGPRLSQISLEPLPLRSRGPFKVAGAWKVISDDARFGGISGLAMVGDRFIALTDDGALIGFGKPRGSRIDAFIRELPAGPGTPHFKLNRDSEALVRDPDGRGWWVTFENAGEAWLFDPPFERALQRVKLGRSHGSLNAGVEGAAVEGNALLLFSEVGGIVTRIEGSRVRTARIENYRNRLSEAANLSSRRILLIERWVTALGFRNSLATLEKSAGGYRIERRFTLPGSGIDNFEALAVERTASGIRLWLMSDDSFEKPFRTLLVALDVEPDLLEQSP